MVIEHKVKGYENFVEFMSALDSSGKPIYVYFSGDKANGESWCPDCIKAEPVVREQLKHADPESVFIYVEVGDRPTWKNPQCPFRKDSRTKLMQIPTLVRWGGPQKLAGEQCEKPELVEMLFTDED
ncbi:thioredoxin domain-containing protein 17-like [Coccinella septempunctata]|uniref:thioredoxin domain-containing protein 17-like n=1 Tax=Coccinella septempunctata TaxID=41139 RepID=UPI001D0910A5|nr:thioredoxin domain-containing protein 17-like [Coccinella septempunctata]